MKLSIHRHGLNDSADSHRRQIMTARHEGVSAVMTALVISTLFIPTLSYPLVLNATSTNGSTLLAFGGKDQQSFTTDFSECVCNQNICKTAYAEVDPADVHDNASHVMSSEDVPRYDNMTYFICPFPIPPAGKLRCTSLTEKRNRPCITRCTVNIMFNCSSSQVAILAILTGNNSLSVYHSSGLSIFDCCQSRTTVTNRVSVITIPSSGNLTTTPLTSLWTTASSNLDYATSQISTVNIGIIVGAILAAILVSAIVVVIVWKKKTRGQLRRGDYSQNTSVPGLWSVDGTVERNNASSTTAPEVHSGERKMHASKTRASHTNKDSV